MSTTALKTVLDEQFPEFEKLFKREVTVIYMASARVTQYLDEGSPVDIVIATAEIIDLLAGAGKISSGSQTPIAHSAIGFAVRPGAPKPNISNAQSFKQALLSAGSIMTSNPVGGGWSGRHLATIFGQLDIADAIASKLRYAAGGPNGLVGFYLLRGETEIGIQQMPELLAVPGIDIVGPLPEEIQIQTTFSAGISPLAAAGMDECRGLIDFLTRSECAARMRTKGLHPVI